MSVWPQGVIPAHSKYLTVGVDLGKYLCHFVVVAWEEEAIGQIVDYGRFEVASNDLGVEQGLLVALREFREQVQAGWPLGLDEREPTKVGDPEQPQQVWIDAGYMTEVVYRFCQEAGAPFLPVVGRGAAQQRLPSKYHPPGANASKVLKKGEGYHLARLAGSRVVLAEVNSDHWKTWIQQRLTTPLGKPGALGLFQGSPQEHLSLAKHLTAERKTEEFVLGKGVVTRWERVRKQNHWLDALNYACAAGHYAGVRLLPPEPVPQRISLSEIQRQQQRGLAPHIDQGRWGEMMRRWHG